MGRLVTPMSSDEFNKLPKWQQWLNRNAWLVIIVLFVTASIVAVLLLSVG